MLEIILFSSICGVFGFSLLALPNDKYSPSKSIVITCENKPDWGPLTVYDAGTGIFKVYHEIEGCDGDLLLDGEVTITFDVGHLRSFSSFGFYRCKGVDNLCDTFNPATPPNKESLHIIHSESTDCQDYSFWCDGDSYLEIHDTLSGNLNPHYNLPLVYNERKCQWYCSQDIGARCAYINMDSLSGHKVHDFKYGSYGDISVLLPEIRSEVTTTDRYIFKVVMHTTHRLPYLANICLKNRPTKECVRYASKAISKEANSGISLVVEEGLFSNDVYMEIAGCRLSSDNVYLIIASEVMMTHRVNKRVLDESQEKIFSKGNDYGTLYFHFSKCDADGIPCDAEEDGKVSVSLKIYGVTTLKEVKKVYIQRDQGGRINECNEGGSYCLVKLTMTKYRDMILLYESLEKVCLWLHVAVTESYTKVCKDISMSITVVDHQDT